MVRRPRSRSALACGVATQNLLTRVRSNRASAGMQLLADSVGGSVYVLPEIKAGLVERVYTRYAISSRRAAIVAEPLPAASDDAVNGEEDERW